MFDFEDPYFLRALDAPARALVAAARNAALGGSPELISQQTLLLQHECRKREKTRLAEAVLGMAQLMEEIEKTHGKPIFRKRPLSAAFVALTHGKQIKTVEEAGILILNRIPLLFGPEYSEAEKEEHLKIATVLARFVALEVPSAANGKGEKAPVVWAALISKQPNCALLVKELLAARERVRVKNNPVFADKIDQIAQDVLGREMGRTVINRSKTIRDKGIVRTLTPRTGNA